jgi:hypothetical protein
MFTLQKLKPADERQRRFAFNDAQLMPWQDGHRLRRRQFDDGCVWRHTVYGGVFDLDRVYETVEKVFGPAGADLDERVPRGESALFAARVTEDGRLLLDSLTMTTAAWAISRAMTPGPKVAGWLDGFDRAADLHEKAVRALVAAAEDDVVAAKLAEDGIIVSRPITYADLTTLVDLTTKQLGVATLLRPAGLRVDCERVGPKKAHDAQPDFLNSFYVDDLQRVADAAAEGDIGQALTSYLTENPTFAAITRFDVQDADRRDVLLGHLAPDRAPAGRWPADSTHPLATSQQLAINALLQQVGERSGMFGVNGPPGTGKTTMLRDLIAALITDRARRLADLRTPMAAFSPAVDAWKSDKFTRKVSPLVPHLTGFEMVIASANNGAVENVVKEIPQFKAIGDDWQSQASYLAQHASRVLDAPAWGLIAAPLGNMGNRERFVKRFWWTPPVPKDAPDTPPDPGFLDWLKAAEVMPEPGRWPAAVAAFRAALAAEETLRSERQAAHDALVRLPILEREHARQRSVLAVARAERDHATAAASAAGRAVATAQNAEQVARERRRDHLAAKPGVWEILFTFGKAIRRWHIEDEPLAAAVAGTVAAVIATTADLTVAGRRADAAGLSVSAAESACQYAERLVGSARTRLDDAYRSCGEHVPDAVWLADRRRREVKGPWLDEQWNVARTRVFLAALDLHTAFIAATAPVMRSNLHTMMDVLNGNAPTDVPEPLLRAAWQSLFLVVPVISTTFASASRLFGKLGRESLGWLLIDEAGQAAPQEAVGAIWRAQRVIAVGDPFQLQPIVSVLHTTQAKLREHHQVSETWLPGRTSVQSLADRITPIGTTLPGPDDQPVWVGAPLVVHRRCANPMFDAVNNAVYAGLMIHETTPPKPADLVDATPSGWVDVPTTETQGNWIPEETEAAKEVVDYLTRRGVDPAKILAITPFRDTAAALRKVFSHSHPTLVCGTVNVSQGKEAEVVILVLGGRPGPRRWAASGPNLFNVAVSRAKQRLYVIGDHAGWKGLPYFATLAAQMTPPRPIKRDTPPSVDGDERHDRAGDASRS